MRLLESENPFLSIRWKFLSKFLGYFQFPPPRNELTRANREHLIKNSPDRDLEGQIRLLNLNY